MTYEQAVELARKRDDAGFRFLYESTYREKYYIALKYMQNEDDALDVLQDAYIRAFDKLDTLDKAERFPAWLGMIVVNTAKNALVKKKPILFSEMSIETEREEPFEFQIEDERIENQPELSYTQEETRKLVRQMISSLSEEQRHCILMYYMEDMSIREIAEALGCSENTVKSRLNYGRKNLKAKGTELQEKGYMIYERTAGNGALFNRHNETESFIEGRGGLIMYEVATIELLFGREIISVFVENNSYIEIIQGIREGYKKQGVKFPIVHLRDEDSLSVRQYQVVIDGEIALDETISQITEGTMLEMLTKLSFAFCDYYNAHVKSKSPQ